MESTYSNSDCVFANGPTARFESLRQPPRSTQLAKAFNTARRPIRDATNVCTSRCALPTEAVCGRKSSARQYRQRRGIGEKTPILRSIPLCGDYRGPGAEWVMKDSLKLPLCAFHVRSWERAGRRGQENLPFVGNGLRITLTGRSSGSRCAVAFWLMRDGLVGIHIRPI